MTKTTTDRIDLNLVDQLLKDYKQPEDILSDNGILKQLILLANHHPSDGDNLAK